MLLRHTHLEINLDDFHHNINAILNSKQDVFYTFVLKANAYGHGLDIIVKELNSYEEIELYAVATLNEAIKVSRLTTKSIFIMGYLESDLLDIAIENGFYVTIFSYEQIKHVKKTANVFIKVDTGFHRLGQYPSLNYLEEIIQIHNHPHINIKGIFTHLRLASSVSDQQQINLFESFHKELQAHNINPTYHSISDGISFVRYKDMPENMVRVGALMYGFTQSKDGNPLDVKPIATLKSYVSRVLPLPGTVFGYGDDAYENHPIVATVAIGYGDGLLRNPIEPLYVTIRNQQCRVINRIDMDQLSVDVSSINECSVGDEVILFGNNGISCEEFSSMYHTNKNEIMSKISPRVPRVYLRHQKVEYIVDELGGVHFESNHDY